jgi:hypothetical protein
MIWQGHNSGPLNDLVSVPTNFARNKSKVRGKLLTLFFTRNLFYVMANCGACDDDSGDGEWGSFVTPKAYTH